MKRKKNNNSGFVKINKILFEIYTLKIKGVSFYLEKLKKSSNKKY